VARRKTDLAGKLSGDRDSRPGWRDTITLGQTGAQPESRRPAFPPAEPPPPEPQNKLKRKTYLLYPDMIAEIENLAAQERVGINDLVRYLLGSALDQVYNGELTIPTQPGRRRIE
jgi:hypothetical protein